MIAQLEHAAMFTNVAFPYCIRVMRIQPRQRQLQLDTSTWAVLDPRTLSLHSHPAFPMSSVWLLDEDSAFFAGALWSVIFRQAIDKT